MPYYHGLKVNEINTGARAIASTSTEVIGMVSIASDADEATFPLNTPVLLDDVNASLGKAGDAGKLAKSLEAIADQASAPVVVVRVAEGADDAETETNIVGTTTAEGVRTGMQALLVAESQLGVKPRILGVPGYDSQQVATDLVTVAQRLRGFAYCKAQGDLQADVINYRQNFDARELMLIWPDFSDFDGSAIARALGLRSKIDKQTGWNKTLSNVAVNGVTGLDIPIPFSIHADDTTTASLLNDNEITTLARLDGYRFWGNRTCSGEPLFAFESAVRTAQVLQDTIAEGLVWAIDKPIVAGLIRDITESVNAKFRQMKAKGLIIGAECTFRLSDNSAEAMAAGRLVFDYSYTPCAPAEAIGLNQRITDTFYVDLLKAA